LRDKRPYERSSRLRRSVRACSYGRTVHVGVVGHRSLSAEGAAYAERVCDRLLTLLRSRHGQVTALSALAEGADTRFADVALTIGVALEVVQPHTRYLDDFSTDAGREKYLLTRAMARRHTILPYRERSDAAYQSSLRWIADRSDVLIEIWDGRPSTAIGGTADTVTYARASGYAVVHVYACADRICLV
jgi:hypothetical protein